MDLDYANDVVVLEENLLILQPMIDKIAEHAVSVSLLINLQKVKRQTTNTDPEQWRWNWLSPMIPSLRVNHPYQQTSEKLNHPSDFKSPYCFRTHQSLNVVSDEAKKKD